MAFKERYLAGLAVVLAVAVAAAFISMDRVMTAQSNGVETANVGNRVAFIDLQMAVEGSPTFVAKRQQLLADSSAEDDNLRREFEPIQTRLRVSLQNAHPGTTRWRELQKEIRDTSLKFIERKAEIEDRLRAAHDRLFNQEFEKITVAIKQVCSEQGYDYVVKLTQSDEKADDTTKTLTRLQRDAVIYRNDAAMGRDITQSVIKILKDNASK